MKATRYLFGGSLIILAVIIEFAHPTCVLESDFGFKINCAFKKSSLFRVRNLGGIKAHASLGFSLGDELGFEQSLTNQDPSRRRSVSVKNGPPVNVLAADPTRTKQEKRGKQNRIMRPVAPSARPNQGAVDRLTSLHRRVTTMQPIIVQSPAIIAKPVPTITMAKPMPMGVPPFRPLPPKEDTLSVLPITATRKTYTPLQVPQSKGPGLAYQSEIYPQSHNQISKMVSQMTAQQYSPSRLTPAPFVIDPAIFSMTTVNPFVPMPSQGITYKPAYKDTHSPKPIHSSPNSITIHKNPVSNFVDPVPHQVHNLANVVYNTKKVDDYNSISGYSDDTVLTINKEDINAKIAEIAKAGNISMEAVEAAIALRQQQLLNKYANIQVPVTTTTTSTTTTEPPIVFQQEPEPEILATPATKPPPKKIPASGKVMNAPREYYPVGYEKNFDDQFQSKVDLPETNFHCGDQKYFPGLYGDESLGCMVFHVCALTDDGLVMKSFLCPESTLFDQTILKCNWWFYVDCKNTKKLYDTNIPVSKSYQLMKALTFFSSYKKEMQQDDGQKTNPEDVSGIQEAMTILGNHNSAQSNSQTPTSPTNHQNAGPVVFITPNPVIDERSRSTTESAPVYRGSRNYHTKNNTTEIPQVEKANETLLTQIADITVGNSTENDSRERKHRRRMTLKHNNPSTTTTSSTTTATPETTPSIEIIKQEMKEIEPPKQETLTDQIEDVNPNNANLAPVKRFYRSSAEIDKEMAVVNTEKVQIVRPTTLYRFVGEYPTQSAVIQRLDEAVLGKVRSKKHTVTIVMPQHSPKT